MLCNYLISCSNGLHVVSWTSISKGMEIVVKLVPCPLCSSFVRPCLPLPLSFSPSVWIANRLRRGPGGIKQQLIAVFRLCYFWLSFLYKDVVVRTGRGETSSGLWCGLKLLAFPLSGGYLQYVGNTGHFHCPPPPPLVSRQVIGELFFLGSGQQSGQSDLTSALLMRRLASSQFTSLNTGFTRTGHVLQGAGPTQYNTKHTEPYTNTSARTQADKTVCKIT